MLYKMFDLDTARANTSVLLPCSPPLSTGSAALWLQDDAADRDMTSDYLQQANWRSYTQRRTFGWVWVTHCQSSYLYPEEWTLRSFGMAVKWISVRCQFASWTMCPSAKHQIPPKNAERATLPYETTVLKSMSDIIGHKDGSTTYRFRTQWNI